MGHFKFHRLYVIFEGIQTHIRIKILHHTEFSKTSIENLHFRLKTDKTLG